MLPAVAEQRDRRHAHADRRRLGRPPRLGGAESRERAVARSARTAARRAARWIAAVWRFCSLGKGGASSRRCSARRRFVALGLLSAGVALRSLGGLRRITTCAAARASSTRRAIGSRRARSPKDTSPGRSASPRPRCAVASCSMSGTAGAPRLGRHLSARLPGRPRARVSLRRAAVGRAAHRRRSSSSRRTRSRKRVARREDVARLAACLSVVCAALRYHTADTMSHGWAALLFAATSLAFAYARSRRATPRASVSRTPRSSGVAVAAGSFATRPDLRRSRSCRSSRCACARARVARHASSLAARRARPARCSFALEQRAVTGAFFVSSQSAYYALADGPPGCFRYGFGAGIGCLHEHGDYVAAVLPRRSRRWAAADDHHAATPAPPPHRRRQRRAARAARLAAPFLGVAPSSERRLGAAAATRSRASSARIALAVVVDRLAYVPFYFDGSYPGGGARFFADVLPLEHVLIAVAVALVLERTRPPRARSISRSAAQRALCALVARRLRRARAFEHLRAARSRRRPPLLRAGGARRSRRSITGFSSSAPITPSTSPTIPTRATRARARRRARVRRRPRPAALGTARATRRATAMSSTGAKRRSPALVPWAPAAAPAPVPLRSRSRMAAPRAIGRLLRAGVRAGYVRLGRAASRRRTTPTDPFDGDDLVPGPVDGPLPRRGPRRIAWATSRARFALQRRRGSIPRLRPGASPLPGRELRCALPSPEEEA